VVHLSVNINKVATVRNSRGGAIPSVVEAARVCIDAGAPGITVHPRADARHISASDVRDLSTLLAPMRGRVEFNIEGDPRPDLLELVHEVKPDQCTLVPVRPGEITSQAGWSPETPRDEMRAVVRDLRAAGVRVSLFVDPEEAPIRWAKEMAADRVELYTEPFARAFERGAAASRESFGMYCSCLRARACPWPRHQCRTRSRSREPGAVSNAAASGGGVDRHALISHAIFVGLKQSVRDYIDVLGGS
jgi:pyridoxine 5-phosphate synthase